MLITPEYISQLITFDSNDPKWQYEPGNPGMRHLQALGTAKVFNLMQQHRVALLADEVGMGKTIQALSVCAAMWRENPKARILVLVPREEIARNWQGEYQQFIRKHYRHNDNVVKSIVGQQALNEMIYCSNLYELVRSVQQGWGKFFLGKISSFSALMSGDLTIPRLKSLGISPLDDISRKIRHESPDCITELASMLRHEIDNHAEKGTPYFDLIIVDEAHYFRHVEGSSIRAQTAKTFFGESRKTKTRIAKQVLLLTATPNHGSAKDVRSIVSYFTDAFVDAEPNDILDALCVRRLRRLGTAGFNKYNYREEREHASDFSHDPLGEMFFGLYQHELAKEAIKQQQKGGGRGITRMLRYLEGVELIPQKIARPDTEDEDNRNEQKGDFSRGADAHILQSLSHQYNQIFKQHPGHPKYDELVERLITHHAREKAVVFVRRIASVFEIAQRVLEAHDQQFWALLQKGDLSQLAYEQLSRRRFNRFLRSNQAEEDLTREEAEGRSNIPQSKVLELFKVSKTEQPTSTHASLFRLRLSHSKTGPFALFFSPGADQMGLPYENLIVYDYDGESEGKENYYLSALRYRLSLLTDRAKAEDIRSVLEIRTPLPKSAVPMKRTETFFTVFWEVLQNDVSLSEERKHSIQNAYQALDAYEREALCAFVEKGTLLASEGLVQLYALYVKVSGTQERNPIWVYRQWVEEVRKSIKHWRLYEQVQESIIHFSTIYGKVFNIHNRRDLLNENWDNFRNAQPIVPYNADNSNQTMLKSFNTPFFPDVLVSTSVLQEGVNLQHFCDTIYHYGMAWTPGDNEQRIGRVDRMFGKIERRLNEQEEATLAIYYPYLRNSVDEDHMRRFMRRKFREETLIDKGIQATRSNESDHEPEDTIDWKDLLRKPAPGNMGDPYPASHLDFDGIETPEIRFDQFSLQNIQDSIIQALEGMSDLPVEVFSIVGSDEHSLLVDPILSDGRRQPVRIEMVFDPIGSSAFDQTVYCLRMSTPLAGHQKLNRFKQVFQEFPHLKQLYLPGIKLCVLPLEAKRSKWYISMLVELPLFLKDIEKNPLSSDEVRHAFRTLVQCADALELEVLHRDLQRSEIGVEMKNTSKSTRSSLIQLPRDCAGRNWTRNGDYYMLEKVISLKDEKDAERAIMLMNHRQFYVKTFRRGMQWVQQVSIHNANVQREELDLLEKHLG
jgi:superfamily II DNA or RNA helicase